MRSPVMVYFGPYERSGHFMFNHHGEEFLFSTGNTLTPWSYAQIDGQLQPGRVYHRGHWTQRGFSEEGYAALHHLGGWTALSIWDSSVDTRPGCSSTYIAEGIFTFDEMVQMAKYRFEERWKKMKFEVRLAIPES